MYGLPLQPVCKSSSSIQSVHTLYPPYSKRCFGLVLQYLSKYSLFFQHYDKNMLLAGFPYQEKLCQGLFLLLECLIDYVMHQTHLQPDHCHQFNLY